MRKDSQMNRIPIPPAKLVLPAILQWADNRCLLTAGDYESGEFNTMTIGWGSLGVMWNQPIAMVVVRPSRYTHEFMERHATFTLSFLPETQRHALHIYGTMSGRNADKVHLAGLTPIASTVSDAPAFDEADLIIECRKIYTNPFAPEMFLQPEIMQHYPKGDFHVMYFGEILAIHGTRNYRAASAAGEV